MSLNDLFVLEAEADREGTDLPALCLLLLVKLSLCLREANILERYDEVARSEIFQMTCRE